MKNFSDFADDINKCSKCGKCQEVCPVYKLTGNDCAVSRGKFVMLKGVLNGDLKLSKTINKYIDMCLKCGKCKDFCPSDIDVCGIFNTAKAEYVKNTFYGKITRLLQSVKLYKKHVIAECLRHDIILSFCRACYVIADLFRNRKISGYDNRKDGQILKRVQNDKMDYTKLLYFDGCVNKIYPKSKNAMMKVLSNYDVEVIEKDFDCCGLPFLSSGNLERFEEAKEHNLELLKGDFDYIITDCASCESTLNTYYTSLPQGAITNIYQFLAIQDKKFVFKKPLKITFHKPCHLKNDGFLKPLLDKCENIEYIEAKDYDECCGFAGEFAIHNPKLSFKMTRKKAKNLADTGADIILTACPACIMGINQGMILNNLFCHPEPHEQRMKANKEIPKQVRNDIKIMNIIEFLAMADEIL